MGLQAGEDGRKTTQTTNLHAKQCELGNQKN